MTAHRVARDVDELGRAVFQVGRSVRVADGPFVKPEVGPASDLPPGSARIAGPGRSIPTASARAFIPPLAPRDRRHSSVMPKLAFYAAVILSNELRQLGTDHAYAV